LPKATSIARQPDPDSAGFAPAVSAGAGLSKSRAISRLKSLAKPHDRTRAARRQPGRVLIGTSGWTYDGWRGPFYPDAIPKKDWLRFYAEHFPTTEINGSFYRTPSLEAVHHWRGVTPKDFAFAWKASKFITHWKRLGPACANSIALMETRLEALAPKAGVVLFQLPPHFSKDCARLEAFLAMLDTASSSGNLLQRHDVALCISDHHDAPSPWEVTAGHVYVRGHGPGGSYRGSYSARTLHRWAESIAAWAAQRRDVFVYFDNDQKAAAPGDARRLISLLQTSASANRNP
jgi:uncharacterized protein YecE (DUF72 family)